MNEYFEHFKNNIEEIWAKKLIQEFITQNNTIIYKHLNQCLELPSFAFTFEKNTWGKWKPKERIIEISYHLLQHFHWDAVIQTLKHEMAHMIVDEIWTDINKKGKHHGELFHKACQIMNIDEKRCHSSIDKNAYKLPEKEKITSKIYKLFCLAESNYKAEAEAAVEKAHELMTKYNISNAELPANKRTFVFRPVGNIYKKVPHYVKKLARIISKYYFVKYIFITHNSTCGKGYRSVENRYIEFYGEPHNIDIAEYVFHFLLIEGEKSWNNFKKSNTYKNRFKNYLGGINDFYYTYRRQKSPYSKNAYIEGFYDGFANTLRKKESKIKKKVSPHNTLPIGLNDPLLKEKYKKHYNPVSWHSGNGSYGGGRKEGENAGKNVKIRQGITRNNNSIKLLDFSN